jgi:hypothetical protein
MPKCTPEERLIAPCHCALNDCQIDAAEAATAQRNIVSELFTAGQISLDVALQRLETITTIENDAYAECAAENARCRGDETLPLKPFTPQQKSQLRPTSEADWKPGVARWMVRLAVKRVSSVHRPHAIVDAASFSIAVFGTCILRTTQALEDVANDPIDKNFKEIPKPVVISLRKFGAADGISEVQVKTLNKWLPTEAKVTSFAQAFVTAINRAQGAQAVEDLKARDRQLAAARKFANEWADTLVHAAGLRPMVALVLSSPEFDKLPISQSDV